MVTRVLCNRVLATVPSLVDGWLTRDRLWRYPIALFLITVGVYLVTVCRATNLIEPGGRIIGHDYLAFYMAGDMVGRGQVDQLYDLSAQQAYQNRFMERINPAWAGTCLYLNPPHYAWAMSMPAKLGYVGSLGAWWVLSLGCFISAALIWRTWLDRAYVPLAIMLVVCMPAWFQAFAGGQNTFFTLLILTAFCSLLRLGWDGWAGLVLSLLAYKFQLMIVPSALLMFKGRWRALGGVLAGCVATVALTAVVLGPSVIADYIHFGSHLGQLMDHNGFDIHKQHSWYGFFYLIGSPWLGLAWVQICAAVASLATLAMLVYIWRGPWENGSARFDLQLAGLIIAMAATSPHMFHYDMLVLVLPAILSLQAGRVGGVLAETRSTLRGLVAIGFVWLAIGGLVVAAVPVQISPVIMVVWLAVVMQASSIKTTMPLRQTCS